MKEVFDSHTHVSFPALASDLEGVLMRARESGVKMIDVGTTYETSLKVLETARKNPGEVYACVGFHPSHVSEINWHHDKNEQVSGEKEVFDREKFLQLAQEKEVVAIGEFGLDYFRLESGSESLVKEEQKKVFKEMWAVAEEVGKPKMLHLRPFKGSDDAYSDTLELIKDLPNTTEKISHFFVGSLDVAKKMLEAGFNFTFGGVITFVRDYDEVIKMLPVENILFETDAPYVTPEPMRGRVNEPVNVLYVAKKIAEIKGVDYDELISQVRNNVKRIFGI